MKQALLKRGGSGFSLIEVMVATAILMVVVLMIGAVFRQASSSWDSGYARAEGGMIVRGVIGSIERELSGAVDGRMFGSVWSYDDVPVFVEKSKLAFICFKEATGSGTSTIREPHLIVYTWGGGEMKRSDKVLRVVGGEWKAGTEDTTIIYSEESSSSSKSPYSAKFEFVQTDVPHDPSGIRTYENVANNGVTFSNEIFWNVASVSINVSLTRTGSFSGLEVTSFGRNGVPDSDIKTKNDDIIVK